MGGRLAARSAVIERHIYRQKGGDDEEGGDDDDCGGYATQKQKQQKSRWMRCIAFSLSRMNGEVEGQMI